MTAREMFEGIGYKLSEAYSEDTLISYFDGKKNITIEFCIKDKRFRKAKGVFDCVNISIPELKAIHKQCEELGWLEKEKKQENQVTNFEHYFEYLATRKIGDIALIDGRVKQCLDIHCRECDFNGDCIENKFKWLKQPYKKPVYKLTKFENDLLQSYVEGNLRKCMFKDISALMRIKEKGYFKGVDENARIEDILANCEVIKDVNG